MSFSQARGGIIHLGQVGGGELHVYDFNSDGEAENIGEIVKEGASFPKLITQELVAPNILYTMPIDENLFPEYTYYVHNLNGDDANDGLSSGSPVRTVQSILNRLPRYLSGDITILMLGTGEDQEEDISMTGFGGDGIIRIKSESGYKRLAGKVNLRHCTNQIIFYQCALKCTETTDIHVKIETCNKVEFRQVKILGENKADDGIRGYYSKVTVIDCEAYNYKNSALTSAITNHMTVKNCKGSGNKYGVWAYDGGIIAGGGTAPTGTTSQVRENDGQILATFTNDVGATPDPPSTTTIKTKYYNASSSGAWRENYGGQWYQNTPYQGEWNGWGRYKGLWFHGTQLSFLSGKTIKSIKIKVKRASSGGMSSGVGVVFRTHNYTSQPGGEPSFGSGSVTSSFSWGQEKWVDVTSLKSAFQSGTAKGFGIYTSSTSNSNYAIFTGSCQIKVTYEE